MDDTRDIWTRDLSGREAGRQGQTEAERICRDEVQVAAAVAPVGLEEPGEIRSIERFACQCQHSKTDEQGWEEDSAMKP